MPGAPQDEAAQAAPADQSEGTRRRKAGWRERIEKLAARPSEAGQPAPAPGELIYELENVGRPCRRSWRRFAPILYAARIEGGLLRFGRAQNWGRSPFFIPHRAITRGIHQ